MANSHSLTVPVDHAELISELRTAGVTAGISIDDTKIILSGDIWDAMTPAEQTAELALVAATESAHSATTCTKVNLTSAPHYSKLMEELLAVAGVTEVGIFYPDSYPGDITICHNSLTSQQQIDLTTAAQNHDASAIPSLSVNTGALVVAADGVATGTITVTDSRTTGANGKTVKLRIPNNLSVKVDADSYTLDANGSAVLTFGPQDYPSGACCLELYYTSGEADEVKFSVRFGT